MPVDIRDIIELSSRLSEIADLKVTIKESMKGACIAGAGAFIGGLLIGPVGIAVGAAAGGCIGSYVAHNKFKPVAEVLMTLEEHQKEKLAECVMHIVSHLEITDASILLGVVMGDPALQKQIVSALVTFLQNEMQMQIID